MQKVLFKLELVIWWDRAQLLEKKHIYFWKLFIKYHLILFNTRIHLLICFWRYEHFVSHGQTPHARAAESVRLFLANTPLQTCSLGPLNSWSGLCETNPLCSVPYSHNIPEKFPTIYISESCHLWFCFVPGFSGCGFSISTRWPVLPARGDNSFQLQQL